MAYDDRDVEEIERKLNKVTEALYSIKQAVTHAKVNLRGSNPAQDTLYRMLDDIESALRPF